MLGRAKGCQSGEAVDYLDEALGFSLTAAKSHHQLPNPEVMTLPELHQQLPPWKPRPSALFEDCHFNQGMSQTTPDFKMKGKLAIKAQTYNQDGFDSLVYVCASLLKTL